MSELRNRIGVTVNRPVPLLCRLLGHRWKPCHRLDKDQFGLSIWVYQDDVCTRCWTTEFRMSRDRFTNTSKGDA